MEVLCYVELKAGIHRWIVASDDGFRVYAGLTPSSLIIGEFNGGRGVADTAFDFIVSQDGLYPFRLMWEQGVGGANVEWEKEDLNNAGTYVAINGDNSIKAYKIPSSAPNPTVSAAGNGMVTLSWTCGTLECTPVLGNPSVWTSLTNASPYTVSTAPGQKRFYRVRLP
jgi:hypothetical protein